MAAKELTANESSLVLRMEAQGFRFAGRDDRGVLQFDAVTESDDWTDEDWAEFEEECGGFDN